ncbi:MAG TPA: heavy metal translocating P-type ATPase, partial [Candidatus Methylomirabilis sp.]
VEALTQRLGLLVERRFDRCTLEIEGLTCRGCSAGLERRLAALGPVASVTVNPAAASLTVSYDAGIPAAQIATYVRAFGYRTRVGDAARSLWQRHRQLLLSVAAGAGLLLAWGAGALGAPPALAVAGYAAAYLLGGGPAARAALASLRRRELDVNILMVLAAIAAGAVGHWDEGAVLLFLFSFASSLEAYAMGRTRRAIAAITALRPDTALVRRGEQEVMVPVDALTRGDRVLVRPGERLPADGVVASGESAVNEAPITGESMPVTKRPGIQVYAGTINGGGPLEVTVTRLAGETTLAKIIHLVAQAQSVKAATQRIIDRFGEVYVPAVLGVAILAALVPILAGRDPMASLYRATVLLVVCSPCALVISTPASVLSAIANAARNGILFKGGVHLEAAAQVRVLAFDKTGTLTQGTPAVTDVVPAAGVTAEAALAVAASLERRSEHPLARAVLAEAARHGLAVEEAADVRALVGRGVRGRVNGREAYVGNASLLVEFQHRLPADLEAAKARLEGEGKTVVCVGTDRVLGLMAVADPPRADAAAAVTALRHAGIGRVVMLTGDNARVADAIGRTVGVDEVHAELLPQDKVHRIRAMVEGGRTVAMVGDGINDAPALAAASLGIAMGVAGSDAALETADVVLMGDDLRRLPYAFALGRRARRVIVQNLAFSSAVIATLIVATLAGWTNLTLGVIGHEGNTLLVVLNGLRLLRTKRPAA